MKSANGINLTMLCDFYELTMGNGYFADGMQDRICYFDIFYRRRSRQRRVRRRRGAEQIVDYVEKLHFGEEDIAYLRSRGIFSEGFLDYLRDFKFTGRYLGDPRGHAHLPDGACHHRPRPGDTGAAAGDLPAARVQPPEPDRHEGEPRLPRSPGPRRA